MVKSWLAHNPLDRPVLAELVTDPLFREFITLKPYKGRMLIQQGNSHIDHDGFLVRENVFAGKRTSKNGQIEIGIFTDLDKKGFMVG